MEMLKKIRKSETMQLINEFLEVLFTEIIPMIIVLAYIYYVIFAGGGSSVGVGY